MTDTFTQDDFDFLLNTRTENCLSLFMPTVKAGPEVRQNAIRFKNLLAEAEALLSQRQVSSALSDKSLESVLREEKAPLVLAAVDYVAAFYREANTYRHLREEFIEGNPDELSPEELQKEAWSFVDALIKEEERSALMAFEEKAGTGGHAFCRPRPGGVRRR